jgi:hypothetical protein
LKKESYGRQLLCAPTRFYQKLTYVKTLKKRIQGHGLIILKWYSEEETEELRESFEKVILKWPQVTSKKMFGCPCYLANGKMFAGMVTKGIVITKLSSLERDELQKIREIKPFVAGTKTIRNWVRVDLDPKDLTEIIPYVRKSYERAMNL